MGTAFFFFLGLMLMPVIVKLIGDLQIKLHDRHAARRISRVS